MRLIRFSLVAVLAGFSALSSTAADLVLRAEIMGPHRLVVGTPLYVRMTLENVSDQPITLPFPLKYTELSMRIIGPDGKMLPWKGSYSDSLGSNPAMLPAGETVSRLYSPNGDFVFDKIGPYRATGLYSVHRYSDGPKTTWGGSIESAVLTFAIDPLPPGEKAAYEATIAFSFGHPGLLAPTKKQAADFLEKFHDSLFAPYVQFALGEERAGYEDYNAALPYFQAVINDPTAPLRGLAAERLKACQEELARKVASGESPPHEIGQPVKGQPAAIP